MTQSTNLKATVLPTNESRDRRSAMLRTAFGPEIAAALADPTVIEVMVNPDGRLWLDRLGQGRAVTGTRLTPEDAERIIRLVASHIGREVHADAPVISAELPGRGDAGGGERFEGLLPPVVGGPCFAGRCASGGTFWWPVSPRRARPRWPTRCWRRWRRWTKG